MDGKKFRGLLTDLMYADVSSLEPLCEWNGYQVYSAVYTVRVHVMYPSLYLEKGDEFREATDKEYREIKKFLKSKNQRSESQTHKDGFIRKLLS